MSKVKWNFVGLLGILSLAWVGCERHGGGRGTAETWFAEGTEGFVKIGGSAEYVVEDGVLIGRTVEGSPNTFLCSGPHADFELEFEVLCDVELNSGVQIRSHVYEEDTELPGKDGKAGQIREKGELYGYQCEIVKQETGQAGNFWDEARERKWWDDFSAKPEARTAFKDGEWNVYKIRAVGDHIQSWVNGVPCADFHDGTDAEGLIGFQVHSVKAGSGPYKVQWRNVRFKAL